MIDYGIWTVITPLVTIILAILTRQVMISLLAGVVVGFTVMAGFNPLTGVKDTLAGIIDIFTSAGNTRTILFCLMVGGIIRLMQVTGGTIGLIHALTEKSKIIKNKQGVQLLAFVLTIVIFVESYICVMTSGAASKDLARQYGVSKERMSYIIHSSCVSVCSSAMINGWGAAMMAVIGIQISKGYITGEPFEILAGSMLYNFMAWFSFASILFYVFTDRTWGPMKVADDLAAKGIESLHGKKVLVEDEDAVDVIEHKNSGSIWNFLIPLVPTILMVPISLFITGNGDMAQGSGSTSVFWAVSLGTVISFIWFIARGILTVDSFFKHLFDGYATMVPLCLIMVLAFLMGNISGDLNTGAYITHAIDGIVPVGFAAAFVFVIGCIMSLATGTSWGTFAIMIPIGIQIGAAIGIDPQLMIGAAISGAIFGDITSPISDTGIVASMITGSDHIEHIRTQFPLALVTGFLAFVFFSIFGFAMTA